MREPIVIWDLPDEPDGNTAHIEEHGITQDEVEEVVQNPDNPTTDSISSGRPITFGWTSTGRYIAVVWEHADDDPWAVRPVTAYETDPPRSPPRKRKKRR